MHTINIRHKNSNKVIAAVKVGAGQNGLRGFTFRYLNLAEATFSHMNLAYCRFHRCNLRGVTFYSCNLGDAQFHDCDLTGANLSYVNLTDAEIHGCNLTNAFLPSPTMMLMAEWGNCTRLLTRDLMRYDAANHPNPQAFIEWGKNWGECPYAVVSLQRAAHFKENRDLIRADFLKLPVKSAHSLMVRLLKEHCPLTKFDKVKI
jgi:uncharacterized protein YjbI with pentapeptide repeats